VLRVYMDAILKRSWIGTSDGRKRVSDTTKCPGSTGEFELIMQGSEPAGGNERSVEGT
jgi:hypothetical protein